MYVKTGASKHTDSSVFHTELRYKIRNTEKAIKYTDLIHVVHVE